MLKLAVIDKNPLYLDVMRDMLSEYKPDVYNSSYKFLQIDHSIYDVIIIDHSIEPEGWQWLYQKINNSDCVYGITSTHSPDFYDFIADALVNDRITGLFKKNDYQKMSEWVFTQAIKKEVLELTRALA